MSLGGGRGTAEKNWQRWQCQAPVTHCLSGLTGVREGKAPETQPSYPTPPDASSCGFAPSGLHCTGQSRTPQHSGLSYPEAKATRDTRVVQQGGLCSLQSGRTCSTGTWVSQYEAIGHGCGFRPVLGEGLCSGCMLLGSRVAL